MSENVMSYSQKQGKQGNDPVSAKPGKNIYRKNSSPIEQVKFLHKNLGNQAVQRLFKSGEIQAKLRIGKPNDKHEQEADRVADQVMRMPEKKGSLVNSHWSLGKREKESSLVNGHSSLVQRKSTCPECMEEEEAIQTKPIADQITPLVQRQPLEEEKEEEEEKIIQPRPIADQITPLVQREPLDELKEEEEEEPDQFNTMDNILLQRQFKEPGEEEEDEEKLYNLQTKGETGASPKMTPSIESNINTLKGRGQPLSESTRSFFEPRFGYDFSKVRVHTDGKAAETASSINAKAFTTGKDMVFGTGQYSPTTLNGKHLLAHELTHVMQQVGGNGSLKRALCAPSIETGLRKGEQYIQRACGPREIAAALKKRRGVPYCIGESGEVVGKKFRFRRSCDEFLSGTEARNFNHFLKGIREGDFFVIHGFASEEGQVDYNIDLSCARAKLVAERIRGAGGEIVETIAHGPTPGVRRERRSVVVKQALIPGREIPPPCLDGIRTVDVVIFSLPGSSRNPYSDLAFANRVFADCCVHFNSVCHEYINGAVLGDDNILDISNDCGALSDEEKEMFSEAKSMVGFSGDIWVFYVPDYTKSDAKGLTCIPSDIGGERGIYPLNAYISNSAGLATLAHEFGHIMLDSGAESGILDPKDMNNLMVPQDEPSGERITLDDLQCDDIFYSPLI